MRIKPLLSDISASSFNKIMTLCMNSIYFILIGIWIPKSELGLYAYYLAITTVTTELLTIGTNNIIVRQIAENSTGRNFITSNALFQRITFPLIFLLFIIPILLMCSVKLEHRWLAAIAFLSCSIIQVASVWRQVLIAEEEFWWAAMITQCGLIIKIISGLTLIHMGFGAIGLFIALLFGSIIEYCIGFWVIHKIFRTWIIPVFDRLVTFKLIKEGIPLMFAFLFNQALARADWILMGILRTEAETGEYAFAYRVYEICWLPHAIIGMVILPKLCRILHSKEIDTILRQKLSSLHEIVVQISVIVPLIMVFFWTPIIDFLTKGKYGLVNMHVIYALVLAVPFAAGINVMWNLAIAQCRQKIILVTIIIASIINIVLNLIFTAKLGGFGAAISTTISMFLQYIIFLYWLRSYVDIKRILVSWVSVIVSAFVTFYGASQLSSIWILQTVIVVIVYVTMLFFTGSLKKNSLLEVFDNLHFRIAKNWR